MWSTFILILFNTLLITNAFNSYSSKLVMKRRFTSRLLVRDSSQFITSDNIVFVEIIKGVVSLGTIVLFTKEMKSSGDKRIAEIQSSGDKRIADLLVSLKLTIDASDKRTNDHISACDKRTNDHISSNDKRFSDLLASMKDTKVIEGELLKEKLNSTNYNIKKLTEDVEKVKEKYVKKDEEKY